MGYHEKTKVQDIINWFHRKYERIEESTPRNDGDWVFIWGDPDSTQNLIVNQWGESEGAKLASRVIEHDCDNDEWVPVPKEGMD